MTCCFASPVSLKDPTETPVVISSSIHMLSGASWMVPAFWEFVRSLRIDECSMRMLVANRRKTSLSCSDVSHRIRFSQGL